MDVRVRNFEALLTWKSCKALNSLTSTKLLGGLNVVDGTLLAFYWAGGTTMAEQATTETRTRTFMDVPTATRLAGFSIRHFHRIIEEDEIPIMQIGQKFFIVAARFEEWQGNQGQKRVGACLQH